MRTTIDNKIVFDDQVKCSVCGATGAFDCTSEFLCGQCMTLKARKPQIETNFPVVLLFKNDQDRDEFVSLVKFAKRNFTAEKL